MTPISPREKEVLELLMLGKTNAEIGMILGISTATVMTHVKHVMEKLDAHDRTLLAMRYRDLCSPYFPDY